MSFNLGVQGTGPHSAKPRTEDAHCGSFAGWHRSGRCNAGTCVEVRVEGDLFLIRDSKQNDLGESQPMLQFERSAYRAFLRATVGAEPAIGERAPVVIEHQPDGHVALRAAADPATTLIYTAEEWAAWVAGVENDHLVPVV